MLELSLRLVGRYEKRQIFPYLSIDEVELLRDGGLSEVELPSEEFESCHGLLALQYLHYLGVLIAEDGKVGLALLLEAEEVLLGEVEVLLKGLLRLYSLPYHI
jgi:hypothetical protein